MSANLSEKALPLPKAKKKSLKSKVSTTYSSRKKSAPVPEDKVVKRTENREYSIFIDGVSLDRACRRLGKRISYEALVKSLCTGSEPAVARYYTLLTIEDDARQSSFYDAVARAGLDVVKKRLPPKNLNRVISTDLEMACDILATVLNRQDACDASLKIASGDYSISPKTSKLGRMPSNPDSALAKLAAVNTEKTENTKSIKKVIITVCASKEVSYALNICRHLGAETINADFGAIVGRDVLRGAERWVDLGFSEKIWKSA